MDSCDKKKNHSEEQGAGPGELEPDAVHFFLPPWIRYTNQDHAGLWSFLLAYNVYFLPTVSGLLWIVSLAIQCKPS